MNPPWPRSITSSAPLSMANKKPRFLRSEDFPQDKSLQRWFDKISDKLFINWKVYLRYISSHLDEDGRKATYRGHIGRRDCAIWNRGSQLVTSSLQPKAAFHQHQRLLSLWPKQGLMMLGMVFEKKSESEMFWSPKSSRHQLNSPCGMKLNIC